MDGGDVDVVVLGGGLAGLTGALQLKRHRPETSVVVVDKRTRPFPPAAFKVGESIAEVAAYYLKDVMGLDDHLREHHLRKMALRLFAAAEPGTDLADRIEYGPRRPTGLMNFHLDRGCIEEHLREVVVAEGIDLREGVMANVALGEGDARHTVTLDGGDAGVLRPQWVLDASGRVGLLRRKLGLGYELPIHTHACWFRTPDRLETDTWSDDPRWRAQVPGGTRWQSTTTFVGEGYWIWVINLASGATSVGIVADPRWVPFERIRRYDAAHAWMCEHEPVLAAHLPPTEDGLLDFAKLKNFSYGTTRAFSRNRWCATGEAALFLDPLYSTGHDFTAIANTLATDVIASALDGEDDKPLRRRIREHNRFFLAVLRSELPIFAGQLEVYRDPSATGAKFIWDNISYFSLLLTIAKNGLMTDAAFIRSIMPILRTHMEMNEFMQDQFRRWSRDDWDTRAAGTPVGRDELWDANFEAPQRSMTADEVRAHLELSLRKLHALSREMVTHMCQAAGREVPPAPYDPPAAYDEPLLHWTTWDAHAVKPVLRDGSSSWQTHHVAA
jgi:flavin-dependent dehydrogenase